MDITSVKEKLTQKYSDTHGIHGCGIRQRGGVEYLTILHVPQSKLSWPLKREIRRAAAPFEIEFIAEGLAVGTSR